jgi:hypothetical protein
MMKEEQDLSQVSGSLLPFPLGYALSRISAEESVIEGERMLTTRLTARA